MRNLLAIVGLLLLGLGAVGLARAAEPAPASTGGAASSVAEPVEEAFKRALFEEEGRRNFETAARGYEQVLGALDEQRRLAATALFRLAECYRKLGRTNDAVVRYQRLLRDFSGEENLATLSRQHLGALGVAMEAKPEVPRAVGGARPPSSALAEEAALLASQLEAVSKQEPSAVVATVESFFPENRSALSRLRQTMHDTESQLTRETVSKTRDHPDVVALESTLKRTAVRLEEEVAGILSAQRARLAVLKGTLERLAVADPAQAQAASGGTGSVPGAGLTSEEAEEIRRIQGLVQNSPDLVNAEGPGGTPLQRAAAKGQLMVVKYLLDHGAQVDLRVKGAETALLKAAGAGHKAIVELLLERGAKVDLPSENNSRMTPLHVAAREGLVQVAEVLLRRGAAVNALGQDGTPLYLAANGRRVDMVRFLLEHGADPNLRAERQLPPVAVALDLEILKLLLDHRADPNLGDGRALMNAIAGPSSETVPGSPARPADRAGGRATGSLEAAELLLKAGANPNLAPAGSPSPLATAIYQDRQPLVELLLRHGADVNHWGATRGAGRQGGPLDVVCDEQAPAMVGWLAWLLEHGADPNRTNSLGQLPLQLIQPAQAVPLARADPVRWPDGEGRMLATNRWAKVVLLLEHGADPRRPFSDGCFLAHHVAVWAGAEEFRCLTQHSADLQAAGVHGITPLMVAVANGNREGVEALLAQGADLHATDDVGNTALHMAVLRQVPEIAKLLLRAGARPGVTNQFGHEPRALLGNVDYPASVLNVPLLPDGNRSPLPGRVWRGTGASSGPAKILQVMDELVPDGAVVGTVLFHGQFQGQRTLRKGVPLRLGAVLQATPREWTGKGEVLVQRAEETLRFTVADVLKPGSAAAEFVLLPGDRVQGHGIEGGQVIVLGDPDHRAQPSPVASPRPLTIPPPAR